MDEPINVAWTLEGIACDPDPACGAVVEQLTSQPVISTNVYPEQRFASADGRRVVLERRPFGGPVETWVADLPSRRLARLALGRPLAANAPRNAVYVLDDHGPAKRLLRMDLAALTVRPLVSFDPDRVPRIATVSPDERWLVGGPFPLGGNRFALHRVDLTTGQTTTLAELDDASNPHLQFDHGRSDRLLVQINRTGLTTTAQGPGPLGATLAVLNLDGALTPLPVGVPQTPLISGHETWIGQTGRILFTSAPADHPSLIASTGVYGITPGDAAATPLALGRPVNHLAVSDDGRFFVVDEYRTWRIWIGSVATGRMELLCDSNTRQGRPQYTHAHPYLTPDNQHVIFNSNVTGVPQVYSARVPDGFLDRLLAQP
jgi:hypothetical protein